MVVDMPLPPAFLARLRQIAETLPRVREEDAWRGVRWKVGATTFAHAFVVSDGAPASYCREAGTDGPATLLMLHAAGEELVFFSQAGPPYFSPPWSPTAVGMVLDGDTDWTEVAEAFTESYRVRAPARLSRLLDR